VKRHEWVVLIAIAATILLLAFGIAKGHGAGGGVVATERAAAEVCFPQRLWNAYREDLPCDLLQRPQEDGSGRLTLGTLGSDAAICVVPNPYEQRKTFQIACHRVPNH
jgi:hypothetical protein